jgi:hypothetical protein
MWSMTGTKQNNHADEAGHLALRAALLAAGFGLVWLMLSRARQTQPSQPW